MSDNNEETHWITEPDSVQKGLRVKGNIRPRIEVVSDDGEITEMVSIMLEEVSDLRDVLEKYEHE